MNGLENITKAIADEAAAQAADILKQADEQCAKILDEAKLAAQAQVDEIDASTERKVISIMESAQSFCALDKKNAQLKAKMQLINEVFGGAVKYLCTLPDDDYFSCLNRLIAANALPQNGLLILNSKDLGRLPSGFMSMVSSNITGGELELCKQPNNNIIGGCILKYGDIEINLSFERIILSQREQLIDKVNHALFG
ncbi:MAG: V-type ATP synthase subunit E [Acutalibacteraceae bacterium]|nr:V-type ATP synthase subunit E [Acutalibacteraceae bacterium]